jgi:hypothetical protein
MFLHRIGSLAVTSLLAGAVSFAIACGGSETISKSHDHSTHSHGDGDDDGAATAGELPTEGTGGHEGGGHDGHEGNAGDAGHEGHDMGGADEPTAEQLVAAEMAAYEAAKPVFEQHCGGCHNPSDKPSKARKNALKHFSMGSYPFGGHHAAELGVTIREVLGAGDGEATMPKDDPGAVEGDELERILAWADAYEKAHAAGAGHHGQHGGHEH